MSVSTNYKYVQYKRRWSEGGLEWLKIYVSVPQEVFQKTSNKNYKVYAIYSSSKTLRRQRNYKLQV